MENEHKQKHVLSRFIGFTFKIYKTYYFILLGYCLIKSATTIFGAYSISILISYLEAGDYSKALYAGLFVALINMGLFLLSSLFDKWNQTSRVTMEQKVNQTLANKIMSLPFSYLEDPYYIELKKNVQMGINNMGAVYDFLNSSVTIVSSFISIIGLGAIILSFDPIIIVVLLVAIAFNILFVFMSLKFQMKFYHQLLPINFHFGYYMENLMSTESAKDFRLYPDMHSLLETKFEGFGDDLNKYFIKINLKQAVYSVLTSTVQYVEMGFIYVLVGIKTIVSGFTIAQFSLTAASAISFSSCVLSIIEASSHFIRSVQYVTPLMEFMSINEDKDEGDKELKSIDTITFDHVTFSYPKTNKVILNDVSFDIHRNEKISIVGLNGAGKTTIVKLISRLYHPDKGRILINGVPIQDYKYDSYISAISAVFQDYTLMNYSIKENIRPGISSKEVEKIGKDVGIDEKIQTLKEKYDTPLGKDFSKDGVELSGGQRQKIAIARALAKPADLLILDEPTSALDPLAEAEIYENFNALAKNRTALYISHRMSSSVFCDKILVLDHGIITDFDSHKNLMKKKESLYYKLFTLQAKNYQLKKKLEEGK